MTAVEDLKAALGWHDKQSTLKTCQAIPAWVIAKIQIALAKTETLSANIVRLRMRLDELTAERDGLAKDAARYRWLRDCHNDSANVVCVMHDFQLIEDAIGMDRPELLNLDFCVDAMVQK